MFDLEVCCHMSGNKFYSGHGQFSLRYYRPAHY